MVLEIFSLFIYLEQLSHCVDQILVSIIKLLQNTILNYQSFFLSGIQCFESRFSFLTIKHTATEITPVKPHTHSPTGTSCHCGKKRQIRFNTESLFKKHSLCLPTYFLIAFESSANDVKVPRSSSANTMQKHSFFSAVPSVLFFFHWPNLSIDLFFLIFLPLI